MTKVQPMFNRICCVAVVIVTACAAASRGQPTPDAQRDAMKKLDFLVGEWKGESWSEFVPGKRTTSQGTETVQSKLNGLLVVMEGVHRRKGDDKEEGKVTHSAFAVASYGDKAKQYRVQAYTDRG